MILPKFDEIGRKKKQKPRLQDTVLGGTKSKRMQRL